MASGTNPKGAQSTGQEGPGTQNKVQVPPNPRGSSFYSKSNQSRKGFAENPWTFRNTGAGRLTPRCPQTRGGTVALSSPCSLG